MKRYVKASFPVYTKEERQVLNEFHQWIKSSILNKCSFLELDETYPRVYAWSDEDLEKYGTAYNCRADFILKSSNRDFNNETFLILNVNLGTNFNIVDFEARFVQTLPATTYINSNLNLEDFDSLSTLPQFRDMLNYSIQFYEDVEKSYAEEKIQRSENTKYVSNLMKTNRGPVQHYLMQWVMYDKGSSHRRNEKTYRFTAPGDYWALFGTKLKKNVTPSNLSYAFDTSRLQKIVKQYPTFDALVDSDELYDWTVPDEYQVIAYLQNEDTGRTLFEYDLEDDYEE